MKAIIILCVIELSTALFCLILFKKNKKLKKEIGELNYQVINLRSEKDLVQMKNFDLTTKLEKIEAAQKKAETAKSKAVTAKKQVEAKSENLKKTSTDRIATASSILSKQKSSSKN